MGNLEKIHIGCDDRMSINIDYESIVHKILCIQLNARNLIE